MRGWLLVVVFGLGGCLRNAAFPCSEQSDCLRGGEQGVCEVTGFCSFADPACADGRRYGDLSGSLSNQCVGSDTPLDGPSSGDGPPTDGPPTDGTPAAPFCDAAHEPTLVGCWEFENVLTDASGDGNTGTGTNVSFGAGKVGQGAVLAANSHIAVADSASLTPTAITLEGWIKPTALPATGARMGVIDNDGQYGLFLQPTGLSCTVSVAITATVTITPNVFTHVACTYDGTTGHVYVDGTDVGTATGGTALDAGTAEGGALGGNSPSGDTLVGTIDQFRVWNTARTAQQICTAAGKSSCP